MQARSVVKFPEGRGSRWFEAIAWVLIAAKKRTAGKWLFPDIFQKEAALYNFAIST